MAEEFHSALYGGSWWISPRTACNHSSCSSDIADMENLGPFWPKNLMHMTSKSIDESSDGIIDWNQNFLSVQEEMNTFSTTGDDGLVAEIEADHQVFGVDQQQSLDFTTTSTGYTTFPVSSSTPYGYGYPLSLVQSLFNNNSPQPSPPPPSNQQPLYDYQSNSNNRSFTGNLTNNTTNFKRPRLETPSSLPTFKVRKEKLGDRITALQQLVSPFGKTDTASVLHEAIDYIKLLHDQVNILSAPYMKRVTKQHQPFHDNVKDEERQIQDLRGQGLCLVPVSDMFPVATEMATGFWTPSYEGSFN